MSLKHRIELIEKPRDWLNDMATEHHYMHSPVHQRAVPFGWAVQFDGELCQPDGKPNGFIIFASIHFVISYADTRYQIPRRHDLQSREFSRLRRYRQPKAA